MDEWGCEECRGRVDEIAAWLKESFRRLPAGAKFKAARRLWQFVEWRRPFESLVELAIDLAELTAWRQSEIADLALIDNPIHAAADNLFAALAQCPAGEAIYWEADEPGMPPICELPLEPIKITGTQMMVAFPGGAYADLRPKPLPPAGRLIRIDQQAGFGDAIELSAVLRHLRHYYPRSRIEVITPPERAALYSTEVPDPTIGRPLVDRILTDDEAAWCTQPLSAWPGHSRSFRDCPSTPAEHCLADRFGLEPIEELCHYWVPGDGPGRSSDRARSPVALCHLGGEHRMPQKNLTLEQRSEVICQIRCAGYSVTVLGEDATAGNAAELIGLIESCDLFVGVDSGPLHLASALSKRAIGLWTYLSPLHCFCPDQTTTHLLWRGPSPDWERWRLCRPVDDGLAFFRAHYRYQWCDSFGEGMANTLPLLSVPEQRRGSVLSS